MDYGKYMKRLYLFNKLATNRGYTAGQLHQGSRMSYGDVTQFLVELGPAGVYCEEETRRGKTVEVLYFDLERYQ